MKLEGLACFMGEAAGAYLENSPHFGPLYREIYEWNWKQLYLNYGANVEFEKLSHQIVFCPETEDRIYAPPSALRYRTGMRPVLDAIVEKQTEGCRSDREKAIALMGFCRDLYQKFDNTQLFYGGTEEELIKKGERLCECLGRLIVALAEVCGIPGRIVMHIVGGHITAELYIEDGWVYIDPRCGMLYEKPDGHLASVRDCIRDPSILYTQPAWVKELLSPLWTYAYRNIERNAQLLLHPRGLQTFCTYSLADREQYHFDWVSIERFERDLAPYAGYYERLNRQIMGLVQADGG